MRSVRRMLSVAAIVVGGALIGGPVSSVHAFGVTRYVCQNHGSTPPGCYPTIQSAILASAPYDKIVVWHGTYNENLDVPSANTPLTITGSGVTVDGKTTGTTILTVESNAVVSVSGFTITGADSATSIGGIDNFGTLTLTNSLVTNNQATNTGGIYNEPNAMLTLVNTPVTH